MPNVSFVPGMESGSSHSLSGIGGYYLRDIIIDNFGGTIVFSNPKSSETSVVTVSLSGAHLSFTKVATGSATITLDYTDSKGITGTYVLYVTFN